MQEVDKKYEVTSFIIIMLLSLITTFYLLFFLQEDTYEMLWFLPFVYFISTGIFYYVFTKIKYQYGIVFIIANIIIFIRFVLTPFSIVFFSDYNGMGFGPNPGLNSMNLAIILMIIELFSTYGVIIFSAIYYKRKNYNINNENKQIEILNQKSFIVLFLIFTVPLIFIYSPSSLLPKNIFLMNDITSNNTGESLPGFLFLLIPIVRLSILLILLSIFKKMYDMNNKVVYIILAWSSVIFYLSMLISTSRWTIVFSAILCLVIMKKLFPNTSKIFQITTIFMSIFVFITISIEKYSWALSTSTNPYKEIFQILFGQFQEYFSGPRAVAQSIDMIEVYHSQISVITLLNDFLGSVPFISNYINDSNRINVYFNQYLNLHDTSQIIPLLGNGYAYFWFFPMIFMVLAQWLMVKFDYQSQKTRNIEFMYIYCFIGFFFAMSMGFNVQIIFGNFILYFLIPYTIFSLNKKFTIKKKFSIKRKTSITSR